MHRTRVLAILGAMAALLAAFTILDRAGDGGPDERVARQLVPGLEAEEITSILIERPGSEPVLLRRRGDRFTVSKPVSAPADPAAVRDLLATLELLAWRRRVSGDEARDPARGLDPPRATLRVERESGAPIELRLGAAVEEARGAWLQLGDRSEAFLVEAYAARALDRDLDDLRSRRPLSLDPRAAERVELAAGGRRLTLFPGASPRLETPSLEARADPARTERLLEQLDGLALSSFVAKAPPLEEGALRIRIARGEEEQELRAGGRCPGAAQTRLLISALGSGCVPPGPLEALERVLEDPVALFDRRLVTGEVRRVVIEKGGARLELDPFGEAGGAVRDWLTQLEASATGEVEPANAAPAPPLASVALTYEEGDAERLLFHRAEEGRLLARREGGALALVLAPGAGELLEPAPWRFRSRRLLVADPIDLRRATGREPGGGVEAIARGAELGDWRVEAPEGARPDPEAIERLSQAVAPLRALGAIAPRAGRPHRLALPRRVVELVFDPDPGRAEPQRIQLEIGAETERGCAARLRADPVIFELSRRRCEALLGPWTRPGGER